MESKVTQKEGIPVVEMSGEVDLEESPRLRLLLRELGAKSSRAVLDFRGVDYIDSSGLAVLIEFLQINSKKPRALAICGMQKQVRSIFEVVGIHKIIPIFPSVEEGIAFLEQGKIPDGSCN